MINVSIKKLSQGYLEDMEKSIKKMEQITKINMTINFSDFDELL